MRVLLLLGSNQDRERYMVAARERLASQFVVLATSAAFESDPVGAPGTPRFHNQALLIDTDLDYDALRQALREIEQRLDRVRTSDTSAPRTIDIDILLALDESGEVDESVPVDGELCAHHHSCVPAAELCPDVRLGSGRTLSAEAAALPPAPDSFTRIK